MIGKIIVTVIAAIINTILFVNRFISAFIPFEISSSTVSILLIIQIILIIWDIFGIRQGYKTTQADIYFLRRRVLLLLDLAMLVVAVVLTFVI